MKLRTFLKLGVVVSALALVVWGAISVSTREPYSSPDIRTDLAIAFVFFGFCGVYDLLYGTREPRKPKKRGRR